MFACFLLHSITPFLSSHFSLSLSLSPLDLSVLIPKDIYHFSHAASFFLRHDWWGIPVFFLLGFMIIFVCSLLHQHSRLVYSNITTNEQINLHRYPHFWRGDRFSNPFDEDFCNNCTEFWSHKHIDYERKLDRENPDLLRLSEIEEDTERSTSSRSRVPSHKMGPFQWLSRSHPKRDT